MSFEGQSPAEREKSPTRQTHSAFSYVFFRFFIRGGYETNDCAYVIETSKEEHIFMAVRQSFYVIILPRLILYACSMVETIMAFPFSFLSFTRSLSRTVFM